MDIKYKPWLEGMEFTEKQSIEEISWSMYDAWERWLAAQVPDDSLDQLCEETKHVLYSVMCDLAVGER